MTHPQSVPQFNVTVAAIARKHGRMAIGIEAKVLAEAIATEVEGLPPASSAGGGGGGIVGPHHPEHDQPTTLQPRGANHEPAT